MNFTLENENLVISLEGYLRSDNAEAVKKEILSIIAEHPDNRVIFDATNLVYIASSGLRVLLTVQKMKEPYRLPRQRVQHPRNPSASENRFTRVTQGITLAISALLLPTRHKNS